MRYVIWHGCAAVLAVATAVLALAPVALGQEDESDDAPMFAVPMSAEARSRPRRENGPLQVILLSIFGSGKEEPFTPLLLRDVFTDGWDEPWIAPPEDADMPRRQGWVKSADGLFFRNLVLTYQNTEGLPTGQDANLGLFQFQSPLSRRLWISLDVPFVTTASSVDGVAGATAFGDFNVTTRVMLHESRRTSVIAGLGVRTPTGTLSTFSGLARLDPDVQFWRHLAGRWSMRGSIGVDVPLNNFDVLPTNLQSILAIGETITGHDRLLIGDFQYYVSANMHNNLSSAPGHTFFSLTPGFRTHLGGEYFLAGGYEIPLVGPLPYTGRLTFFLVKGF